MQIGSITISNGVLLAPMAGVTDTVFRKIVKEYGAVVVYTEMISSRGLINKQEKTFRLLDFDDAERPIGAQIFGTEPDVMAESTRYIEEMGFDFIDINMGCPAPKITKKGAGAALLKDLPRCKKIFREIKKATKLPITAKTRLGWQHDELVSTTLAKIAEDCGLEALTVHARYALDFFKGSVNMEGLRKTCETVKIPVIGNGDIKTNSDAEMMVKKTGCKAIMVGRAMLGEPWNIRRINQFFTKSDSFIPPNKKEVLTILLEHTKMAIERYGERKGLKKMRKHFIWYISSFPHAKRLRVELINYNSMTEVEDRINSILESL